MINKLNKRLDEISKDMSGLNLIKSEPDTRVTTIDPQETSFHRFLIILVPSNMETWHLGHRVAVGNQEPVRTHPPHHHDQTKDQTNCNLMRFFFSMQLNHTNFLARFIIHKATDHQLHGALSGPSFC
ncbi:uncharacterized protein A4U43_C05F3580 [Asparagus officinalis]|uniref:Uncharacterized protein n=1 Tax=Asparagus officinalis TaxID=4686 RepID=A0A5P1ESS6_ASPOF|nr:uncharacterized protein A4U43_C05F3580 [Asparagus officinalis]